MSGDRDLFAGIPVDQHEIHRALRFTVNDLRADTFRREVPVAPVNQRQHHRPKVQTALSEQVFETRRFIAILTALQQALFDQLREPTTQHIGSDIQILLKLVETLRAIEAFTQDQHAPPLTYAIQATRQGALIGPGQLSVHSGRARKNRVACRSQVSIKWSLAICKSLLEESQMFEKAIAFSARPMLSRAVWPILSTLTAVSLIGCSAVGPDYKQPASAMPDAYHHEDALAARPSNAPAPALDSWWKGFNDPELTRIVNRALAQNLDLAAAMARIQTARAAANYAGARELPEGGAYAQAERLHQSLNSPLGVLGSTVPGYARNQTLTDVGIDASWEIDLFGGLRRGAEAADAEAQAAEAEGAGVRISVVAEAADAYFRVRGAQQRIAIAQRQVDNNTQLLQIVRWRFNDGLATTREVAEVQALIAQSRATIPPAANRTRDTTEQA
jgi:hypothetical protein